MQTTIQKWGNSRGVRIPKSILDNLNFKENDVVEIKEENGSILIQKAINSLDDLFKGYNGNYKCSEFDFGNDVGSEKL